MTSRSDHGGLVSSRLRAPPPFNTTARRVEVVDTAHAGGAHAFSGHKSLNSFIRESGPPFMVTGRRSPIVPLYAIGGPSPTGDTSAPSNRSRSPAPTRVLSPDVTSTRRGASIPYTSPPDIGPDAATYSPRIPATKGPKAFVAFSLSNVTRPSSSSLSAASLPPGPGSYNPLAARDTGGAFKAVAPGAAFAHQNFDVGRSFTPQGTVTPGPGTYTGVWSELGFSRAADRSRPSTAPFGVGASRDYGSAIGGGGAGARQQEQQLLSASSPSRHHHHIPSPLRTNAAPIGGSEARFALPPDERQLRENPPPGTYTIAREMGSSFVSGQRAHGPRSNTAPALSSMSSAAAAAAALLRMGGGGGGGGNYLSCEWGAQPEMVAETWRGKSSQSPSHGGSDGKASPLLVILDPTQSYRNSSSSGGNDVVVPRVEQSVEHIVMSSSFTPLPPPPPQFGLIGGRDSVSRDRARVKLSNAVAYAESMRWSPLQSSTSDFPSTNSFNSAAAAGSLMGLTASRREWPKAMIPGVGAYDVRSPDLLKKIISPSPFSSGRRSPIAPPMQHDASFTANIATSMLTNTFNARFANSQNSRLHGMPL
jgi:hypothetical protein